jgi:hypothetical protein
MVRAKEHQVIFDTGAAKHISNHLGHMKDVVVNHMYNVVGVNGPGEHTHSSHVGRLNIVFSGICERTGRVMPVRIFGGEKAERNVILTQSSPCSLISWTELKKKGWKLSPDGDFIRHPSERLRINFEERDGLLYMPLFQRP